jgi:small nuclear ribonucleoprotein (snRNP)-like protein
MIEWIKALFYQYPTLRRVIVNTKTDRAFRGVLWQRRRGYLVLRNAEMLKGKGETAPMDGEVAIDAANVDFVQVLNG